MAEPVKFKIVAFPCLLEHEWDSGVALSRTLAPNEQLISNLEESLSASSARWPWFSNRLGETVAKTRITCKIAHNPQHQSVRFDPLHNKNYTPNGVSTTISSCFGSKHSLETMDVTIIFFELLWNRRLLVALGWIDLCWSGGDDTSKLPSASTGHQTIGIAFTRNSVPALATGETQKIFDAYLSTAMLSSELRANLQFGEFNFFFAPETRNKKKRQRKEEELYTESDETALIYHASSNINVSNPEKEDCCNEGGEGVVKSNRKKKKKMTMEALT